MSFTRSFSLLRTAAARPSLATAASPFSNPIALRLVQQRRLLSQEAKKKIDDVRACPYALSSSPRAIADLCLLLTESDPPSSISLPLLLYSTTSFPTPSSSLVQVVAANPLVLFMKGTPDLPQCGFSRAVCQILEVQGVPPEKIVAFNCLEDAELREGIKEYSCVPFFSFPLLLPCPGQGCDEGGPPA